MQFLPIKTDIFKLPQDDLYTFLDTHVVDLQEWDILFITSKLLAIHQWRCVKREDIDFNELIKQESKHIVTSHVVPDKELLLTLKDGFLLPFAWIDISNAWEYYILRPQNIQQHMHEIWGYIKKKFKLNTLAIVLTDTTTQTLKQWMLGTAVGFRWLEPLESYIGKKDLFGNTFTITSNSS